MPFAIFYILLNLFENDFMLSYDFYLFAFSDSFQNDLVFSFHEYCWPMIDLTLVFILLLLLNHCSFVVVLFHEFLSFEVSSQLLHLFIIETVYAIDYEFLSILIKLSDGLKRFLSLFIDVCVRFHHNEHLKSLEFSSDSLLVWTLGFLCKELLQIL